MRSDGRAARRAAFASVTLAVVACLTLAAGCTPEAPADPSDSAPPTPPTPPSGSPPLLPADHAPSGDARAALAARAAAAQDLAAVSVYAYQTGQGVERTVMAVRAPDGSWRVDVTSWALGSTVDVAVLADAEGQLFHCGLPPSPEGTSCVAVSPIPAGSDPRVQYLFTEWLEVFTDRSAAISVAFAEPPEDAPSADGDAGECFSVQSSAASLADPVDPGMYCYREDGTLTFASSQRMGTLSLTDTDTQVPDTVTTPGPVRADETPLPRESPDPPTPATPSSSG